MILFSIKRIGEFKQKCQTEISGAAESSAKESFSCQIERKYERDQKCHFKKFGCIFFLFMRFWYL